MAVLAAVWGLENVASEPYKQLKASSILDMSDARVATSPVKVLERTEVKTLVSGPASGRLLHHHGVLGLGDE